MAVYNRHQFPGKPDTRSLRQRNWDAGQYPLFMDADDLTDPSRVRHGDLHDGGDVERLERDKMHEATDPDYGPAGGSRAKKWLGSLLDSIAAEGVRDPVDMYAYPDEPDNRLELSDGHHRAFAAKEVQRRTDQPVWVPHTLEDPFEYWPA